LLLVTVTRFGVSDDVEFDGTGENILFNTFNMSGLTATFLGVIDAAAAADDDDDDDDEEDDASSIDACRCLIILPVDLISHGNGECASDSLTDGRVSGGLNDDNSSFLIAASSSELLHLVVSFKLLTSSGVGSKGPSIKTDDEDAVDFQSFPCSMK
jgi:hypothetical protein